MSDPYIEISPKVSDEVKETTCYMCACRCGIKVHLSSGKLKYIEGNRNHPINNGVLCAKGAAGIMKQNSPAKLKKPLKRVGERGLGKFKEIEWDEALEEVTSLLKKIRSEDPKKLAFFTGRDQSQALTGWWAQQFGTPNFAAHGGLCSVNMAAAGMYSIGGSFWEFGEPDWENTKYFMMFGVAEDHSSNPIKIGISKIRSRGAKFTSVNPVRTGYSAVADEWVGIRPGTDGLFVLSLIHELLLADKVDFNFLQRYTNSSWLVIQNEGKEDNGLFYRDDKGNPLIFDIKDKKFKPSKSKNVQKAAMIGQYKLDDGRTVSPVFHLMADRYLDKKFSPEEVAKTTGIPADDIKRLAFEIADVAFNDTITIDVPWTDWLGKKHKQFVGRPVSFHAMRGISAHSNGFQTCRSIHLLQMLLGSIDCPGGWRYKAPYPKATPPSILPNAKSSPNKSLSGAPLGFPMSPEDLLIDNEGNALRLDKAFSWDAPLAAHGMMQSVIYNAWAGDPYEIDALFLYMANMSWNSSMDTKSTIKMLTDKDTKTGKYKIPNIIYSDAFSSEMVAYADIVLPDTTYLERWDCISILDRPISDSDGVADSIRQPVLELDRDVRPFQDVLIDLGSRLNLPGFCDEQSKPLYPGGLKDYMTNHFRKPGLGMLAGWRGRDGQDKGIGEKNPNQLNKYIENDCFWYDEIPLNSRYYRNVNINYFNYAQSMGFLDNDDPIIHQIYSEPLQKFRLSAMGFGKCLPPDRYKKRIETYFDPLPFWYAPLEENSDCEDVFPFHAITQRPMTMYHSWDSQNSWQRQILNENKLYLNHITAKLYCLNNDDWVLLSSKYGKVKCQVKIMSGVEKNTVWTWNSIAKRSGAWGLKENVSEVSNSFLMNHLIPNHFLPDIAGNMFTYSDPITGQAAWYDIKVKIDKLNNDENLVNEPQFEKINYLFDKSSED
ncbi:molybdopterin-dependent oxidoreductase [Alphaproteobacteria bacterium]|nr:molybdopterin-dependent oxidoreductase [Alphaproteobacteria bacterium]